MSAFILFSESFFFVIFFAWPRIGALIVFGYMLLFSTYNDSLREDQSEQNVFIGNYVGRRKIIPTIHLQRAAEDIRCSKSALGIVGIWVRFAWDRQHFYCEIVLDPSEMNDAM